MKKIILFVDDNNILVPRCFKWVGPLEAVSHSSLKLTPLNSASSNYEEAKTLPGRA